MKWTTIKFRTTPYTKKISHVFDLSNFSGREPTIGRNFTFELFIFNGSTRKDTTRVR
jgi:hypothetical protein